MGPGMADTKAITSLVQLNKTNFATWKVQCKMLLINNGLWDIVSEKEKDPGASDKEKQAKFVARRDKALSIIVLAVDPSLLYLLGDPTKPVDVWKRLQNQFQRATWANKLALRRKLNGMRLEDGGSMNDHVREMLETFNELALIGSALEPEDQVITLLASLPSSYDMLITALEVHDTVPTIEVVTERLRQFEMKLEKENSSVIGEEKGLVGVSRSMNRGMRQKRRCWECGSEYHLIRNCHKHKAATQTANTVHDKDQDSDSSCGDYVGLFADAALSTSSTIKPEMKTTSKSSKSWVVDSGATCHMSGYAAEFVNLKKLERPVRVTVGDGRVLTARAHGTVRLRTKRKVKLHNTLFVPGLDYNLLSVDKAVVVGGLRATFNRTQCRMTDRYGQCVIRATRHGGLYKVDMT